MSVIAPSDTKSPAAMGAQISENFVRQMQGLGKMEGAELDRFNRQQSNQQFRQGQLADIEQALGDRQMEAEDTERVLRESGMADVAERFRRASRAQSFNAARRGIQGGSADIQQQAATEAKAQAGAEQAAAQAAQERIRRQLQSAQEVSGFQQQLMGQDPLEAILRGQELQTVQDQARINELIGNYQRQIQQGGDLRRAAVGSGLNQFLTSAGNVGMAAAIGSA